MTNATTAAADAATTTDAPTADTPDATPIRLALMGDGRMGTLVSDAGSVGFYGSMASALATGWSDNIAGHNAVMANYSSRYDNTIAYVSPEFAGVTIYAQYAMGDTNENKASNDRYAALGAE